MGADLIGAFLLGGVVGCLAVWKWGREIVIVESGIEKEVAHLKDDAEKVIQKVESLFSGSSGEAKAHQALALFMKLRPSEVVRDLRLALELAVRRIK